MYQYNFLVLSLTETRKTFSMCIILKDVFLVLFSASFVLISEARTIPDREKK